MQWSDWDKYLRGEHLGGARRVVTIAEITIEEVHASAGVAEEKPVLWFRESKKGLILSPINRRTLASLFGDDAGACVGKRVTLEAVPSTG